MKSNFFKSRFFKSATLICVALLMLLAPLITLSNYSPEIKSTNQGAKYQNAIYIYMCGSTLETKNSVATKNIETILKANISPQTAVVIETGGTRMWRGYDIPNNKIARYEVRNGNLIEISQEDDSNMGDSKTLSSFLKFCNENYSAKNTTLLFWNHGAGSVKGVCLDENHGMDGLSSLELSDALDESNSHFDNVCFDACLMANFETMRAFKNHAVTFIASEEVEPSAGFDYKVLTESLGNSNFSDNVLSSYKDQCESNGKRLFTLSVTDLNKFSKVESAFESFCNEVLIKENETGNLQGITQAANNSMNFGGQSADYNLIDLSNFAKNLGYESLSNAISDCSKTSNGEDRQSACGISIFFPTSNQTLLKNYLSNKPNETYSFFLGKAFVDESLSSSKIEFIDNGSTDATNFNFKISSSTSSNVQNVVYDIYQLNDNSPATCLGFDNDIQTNGKGNYSITFSGRWVALNGHLLSCEPIDSVGDTTVFSAAIKLDNVEGDLRFTFNKKNNNFSLQGFVALEENDTQGRLEDINKGDVITIQGEEFAKKDGLETKFIDKETIEVDDNLQLSTTTLPNGRYQIYGIVTDLYGNEHLTDVFMFELQDGEVSLAYVVKN